MKKIVLLSALIGFAITTQAQIGRPTKTVKKITAPQPNNTPVTITPYYLSSAKVDIFTGNDNKELPSNVTISLYRLSKSNYSIGGEALTLMYNYMMQGNNKQEFKPNSNTQISYPTSMIFLTLFPGGTARDIVIVSLILHCYKSMD